jgi:hypothetical protein
VHHGIPTTSPVNPTVNHVLKLVPARGGTDAALVVANGKMQILAPLDVVVYSKSMIYPETMASIVTERAAHAIVLAVGYGWRVTLALSNTHGA